MYGKLEIETKIDIEIAEERLKQTRTTKEENLEKLKEKV